MDEAVEYVVVEVAQSQGDAASVFQPSVDRFDGTAISAAVVEEGQYSFAFAPQGPPKLCEFFEPRGRHLRIASATLIISFSPIDLFG